MASKTKATRIKRKNRDRRKAAAKKSKRNRKGTTVPARVLFKDA
ncbi:MAG: hypothetical protein NZ480_09350 [Bdellovibrionaceae bacterium]|nr:hypothetical protein [Pseudobdellovibrionaceae bacterium]MDW8189754.1 hypothetical protein [Pseudobdellovibrionaceae bacterium]